MIGVARYHVAGIGNAHALRIGYGVQKFGHHFFADHVADTPAHDERRDG